ncbi:MAG TPA: hypothetical protein VGW32_10860, partial [Pyrinomonadaceae bacterium]|nr:hypothetical protein [Pyrinomonadaceae bacterium]
PAGGGDDVIIYDGNCPGAMRILDVEVLISTPRAGSNVQLRNALGGGGAACSDAFTAAGAGRQRDAGTAVTATSLIPSNGTLVLRRSDRGVAGEVILFVQR